MAFHLNEMVFCQGNDTYGGMHLERVVGEDVDEARSILALVSICVSSFFQN